MPAAHPAAPLATALAFAALAMAAPAVAAPVDRAPRLERPAPRLRAGDRVTRRTFGPNGTSDAAVESVPGATATGRETITPPDAAATDEPSPAARLVPLGADEQHEESFGLVAQDVAALAGGGFATAWTEATPPTSAVWLQYVRADGTPVIPDGGLVIASAAHSHGVTSTAVVADAVDGAFVAFAHWRDDGSGNEILVQRVDGAGRALWPGEGASVFARGAAQQYYEDPRLVAAADGGVFVCARRVVFDGRDTIRCQRLGADGALLWGRVGVAAGGAPGWRVHQIPIADGTGGLLVFWLNLDDAFAPVTGHARVEGQRFDAGGRPLWGRLGRVVHTSPFGPRNYFVYGELAAVADGAGGAVVAFNDWTGRGAPTLDVLAERVDGAGRRLWGSGVAVASGLRGQQLDGLFAAPDGGAFVTVWEPTPDGPSPLWLRRLGPSGEALWGPRGRLVGDAGASGQDYFARGRFDGDRLRLAWVHQAATGTWTFDVFYGEYRLDGRRATPAGGVRLTGDPDSDFVRAFAWDPVAGVGLTVYDAWPPGEPAGDTRGALYPAAATP